MAVKINTSWSKANKSYDCPLAVVNTVGSLLFQASIPSSGSTEQAAFDYRAKSTATKVVRISSYAVHSHTQGLCHPGQKEIFISTFINVTISRDSGQPVLCSCFHQLFQLFSQNELYFLIVISYTYLIALSVNLFHVLSGRCASKGVSNLTLHHPSTGQFPNSPVTDPVE